MDSLTQIVLGAAVGEIVLGRKVGNRAMVWGAISGTVPDLDILANLFMHPIEALAVHRGLSHSIFFALFFPWVMAWMTHRYYEKGLYNSRVINLILQGLLALLALGFINGIAYEINQGIPWTTLSVTTAVVGIYLFRTYTKTNGALPAEADYMDWVKLHFWAVFTHPLLDSCTAYGTQLFQPFSDYRVAFNNIAVADPAYTAPFLLCLVAASFFIKSSKWRKFFNTAGITLSCLYLLWTFYNKVNVDRVFKASWAAENIEVDRYTTGPTILNNILWYGVAQKEDTFYTAFYSLLDEEDEITDFQKTAQNGHLIDHLSEERYIQIVQWFSNGYYAVKQDSTDIYTIKDLRYGIIKMEDGFPKHESVFTFKVEDGENFDVTPIRDADTRNGDALGIFWDRIRGIKPSSAPTN